MKNEKFISFFIEKRKKLGLSQNKIANELGLSDQAISNWERGVSFPDLSYLDDIAKLLQTNVESLIEGKQKEIKIKDSITFNANRLSNYLTKLRKNNNLTQNELGKILDVSGQNISKFETGSFLPSIDLLYKYCDYFKVSFLNVYYGLDNEELYTNKIKTNKNILKYITLSVIIFIIALTIILLISKTNKYDVTIIINENEIITYSVKENEKIELPTLPQKKGYESYWDDTDTVITKDKTFTVQYIPKTYTITYTFNNDQLDDYIQEVTYNEKYELYNLNLQNYKILDYFYNDSTFNSGTYQFDYNIIVTVNVIECYCVTIILDDDKEEVYFVDENTEITLPELPIKKGYTTSWDNTNTLINEDKTFKVIYTPNKYIITYKYDNDLINSFTQEVTYNEDYTLFKPYLSNYSFNGYTFNNEIIENGKYLYDHDIIIYGSFSNEVYELIYEYTNICYYVSVGYNTAYKIENYLISNFINDSSEEYKNYKIIGWSDNEGNVYEVNKTYVYINKANIYLAPIFEYSGNGFEVIVENNEAKIIKYNINRISNLIIPDYIVIDGISIKVTSIESKSFQDIYFTDLTLTSNITKIAKNAFNYENVNNDYQPDGYIYYNGSLLKWFNIEFEDYIVSNIRKCNMRLYNSYYLCDEQLIFEISEGVEVIKTYSCANLITRELIIPDSVHTIEENAFINSIIDLIINLENVQNVHTNAFN